MFARMWRGFYIERQLYLRSNGKVRFVSLPPIAQLAMLAAVMGLCGWVAFASVNVVFKDLIIYAKNQKYRQMQAAYEERLTDLQLAYEDLQGRLVDTEQLYLTRTKALERRQQELTELLAGRDYASQTLGAQKTRYAAVRKRMMSDSDDTPDRSDIVLLSTSGGISAGPAADLLESRMPADPGGSQRAERAQTAPDASAPTRTASTGAAGSLAAFRSSLFSSSAETSELEERIHEGLDVVTSDQQRLLDSLAQSSEESISALESIVAMTGVFDVEGLLAHVGLSNTSVGGPFVALTDDVAADEAQIEGPFADQLASTVTDLERIAKLEAALARTPLAAPMTSYKMTSRFGPRRDPFNRRVAYHSGLDFAAAYGSPVLATTPGTVVHAGWKGAYGRVVEIDNGYGFLVRYAHLSAIEVEVGHKVGFQDVVGRLGSSGRSTGPHLHYEIRIQGEARDPEDFIQAGRYVFRAG